MQTLEAIAGRRSIKHYDPEHIMHNDEEQQLFNLAMQSPTAFNIQNWRFVVVKDRVLRKEIREAAWDQAQVTEASLLIVLCADLKAWEKDPKRYWRNADNGVQEFMVPAIDNYYRDHAQTQRDEAMRSCGMAAQTIMLAAKSMGYDSCPMDGFDFEKVGALIALPQDHVVTMFVVVGKGIKPAWPKPGQLDYSDVVVQNKF